VDVIHPMLHIGWMVSPAKLERKGAHQLPAKKPTLLVD